MIFFDFPSLLEADVFNSHVVLRHAMSCHALNAVLCRAIPCQVVLCLAMAFSSVLCRQEVLCAVLALLRSVH